MFSAEAFVKVLTFSNRVCSVSDCLQVSRLSVVDWQSVTFFWPFPFGKVQEVSWASERESREKRAVEHFGVEYNRIQEYCTVYRKFEQIISDVMLDSGALKGVSKRWDSVRWTSVLAMLSTCCFPVMTSLEKPRKMGTMFIPVQWFSFRTYYTTYYYSFFENRSLDFTWHHPILPSKAKRVLQSTFSRRALAFKKKTLDAVICIMWTPDFKST